MTDIPGDPVPRREQYRLATTETRATFIQALVRAVMMTRGPVLELGMGLYSTPLLHMLLAPVERELRSVDNNHEWGTRACAVSDPFRVAGYYLATSWDDIDVSGAWDVVLLDLAPGEARMPMLERLRANQQIGYVVVHDAENGSFWPFFDKWRFCHHDRRIMPWTTVVSNRYDFTEWPT